jgi:hypothetical protein
MFGWDGLLSPEWCSLTGTFLALGVFLIGTYSVRRLAILRGFIILLAGTAILVLDVVRVRPVHESAELHTTPYVGCYLVGALAVGLLVLGATALRFALMNSNPDADAQAMRFLRWKFHSLWEPALSLCVGSRVKGASSNLTGDNLDHAELTGAKLEGEKQVMNVADLPAMTHEPVSVGGSPIVPGRPTSSGTPAFPNEPLPKAVGFTIKVVKAFLLIVFVCCLFLFWSESASSSAKGHRIQIGFPSPWFELEKHATGFRYGLNLLSWSWAIAALGALSCYLYGAVRRCETAKLSATEKLLSNGCLLWLLTMTFAFVLVAIHAVLMTKQ